MRSVNIGSPVNLRSPATLENEELSADGRRHLEAMSRNARRMAKMLGDLAQALGLEGDSPAPHAVLSEHRRM